MGSWQELARVMCRDPRLLVGEAVGIPVRDWRVILNPVMVGSYMGVSAPNVALQYDFALDAGGDFVAVYGVSGAWPGDVPGTGVVNPIRWAYFTAIIAGGSGTLKAQNSGLMGGSTGILWQNITYSSADVLFAWNGGTARRTATVTDNNGNEAIFQPVLVMNYNETSLTDMYWPKISFFTVTSDGYSVTLQILRESIAISGTVVANSTMVWLDAALGGVADPDNPTNPDFILLTLGPGVWSIGVEVTYHYPPTHAPYIFKSRATVVVEVV